MLVIPDFGDDLAIEPRMSDIDNEEPTDMGDELIIELALHGDRLELPRPVHQPVLQTTSPSDFRASLLAWLSQVSGRLSTTKHVNNAAHNDRPPSAIDRHAKVFQGRDRVGHQVQEACNSLGRPVV